MWFLALENNKNTERQNEHATFQIHAYDIYNCNATEKKLNMIFDVSTKNIALRR